MSCLALVAALACIGLDEGLLAKNTGKTLHLGGMEPVKANAAPV